MPTPGGAGGRPQGDKDGRNRDRNKGGKDHSGGSGDGDAGRPDWVSPVGGTVNYPYGVQNERYEAGYHTGADFGVPMGTPVSAVQKGKVVEAGWNDAYGNYIKILHPNGMYSLYAHLGALNVKAGQEVKQGFNIGRSGNSGNSDAPHLHFEIRETADYGSDINPIRYLEKRGADIGGPSGDSSPGAGGGAGGQGADVQTSNGQTYSSQGQDSLSARELAEEAGWSYSFLKSEPELWKLFKKAVDQGWSPQRFISAMRDTKWFQSNSDTMRNAAVLQKTDPETWQQRIDRQVARIEDMASAMGAQLSNSELRQIAMKVLRFGLEDADLTNILSDYVTRKNGSFVGQAGVNEDELRNYANSMGVKVSPDYVKKVVAGMSRGDYTFEEAQDRINRWAASAFPTLSEDILQNGKSVQELADPYIQTMSALLEINPGEIDLFTPKIRQALMSRDKDNKPAMKTLWEFEQDVRKDERFQFTKTARDEMDQIGSSVLSSWGFM